MNELLQQFVLESREIAEAMTGELLLLEQSPADAERLDSVFRGFHTLKGGAGIVDFPAMERAVHAAEDLLGQARAGKRALAPAGIGACLACLDQVLQWLDAIEQSGGLPGDVPMQADALAGRFGPVASQDPGRHDATAPEASAISGPPLPRRITEVIEEQRALLNVEAVQGLAGRVASAGLTAANALRACDRGQEAAELSQAMEQALALRSAAPLRDALARLLGAPPPQADAPVEPAHAGDMAVRTLRVDAGQVDELVRLAGEFTATAAAIGHLARLARAGDPALPHLLKERHGALERLTAELRLTALGMRVRPLRVVLQRFPRLVRELSATLDKPVRLQIEGEDTEADKVIVEMLFEPLLHVVRNALDHGVEHADARLAAGKPATAHLRIMARRHSGQVIIEVSDDGPGIDFARVREVAGSRGLVSEELLESMTEAQMADLIFTPGFSTATAVTQLSGRGMGMDAVRKAVERVGGRVSVASRAGAGTVVTLTVPFSVMITPVMTLEAGGQMFAVPLEAIIETIRVPSDAIAKVGGGEAVALRGRTIPVIDLAVALGIGAAGSAQSEGEATLLIVAAGGEWGALRVDRVIERLDLVLKPLEGLLASMSGITGTALLGDGRVLLVLDIGEMLH